VLPARGTCLPCKGSVRHHSDITDAASLLLSLCLSGKTGGDGGDRSAPVLPPLAYPPTTSRPFTLQPKRSGLSFVPEAELQTAPERLFIFPSGKDILKLTDTNKVKLTSADIKTNLAKVGVAAADIKAAFRNIKTYWSGGHALVPPTAQLGACGSW
jgi:hypothetical protein